MEWKEGNTYLKTQLLLHEIKKKTFRIYLCEKKGKIKFHEEKFLLFFFKYKKNISNA